MQASLPIGTTGQRSVVVGQEHTVVRWGSGALRVFSTPYMIALMEGAAVDAVDPLLPAGSQTVGTRVDVRHLAASPVGSTVVAQAELIEVDGRKLTFHVQAHDDGGLVGEGTHERFIIQVERFMQRAASRGQDV